MANTNISALVQIVGNIAHEISENELDSLAVYAAQVKASEAMNIISVLLIETGVNPLTTDVLEEFDGYVLDYGNKEIVPHSGFYAHVSEKSGASALMEKNPYLEIEVDTDRAKHDYHAVQFEGSLHYVLRSNPYRNA